MSLPVCNRWFKLTARVSKSFLSAWQTTEQPTGSNSSFIKVRKKLRWHDHPGHLAVPIFCTDAPHQTEKLTELGAPRQSWTFHETLDYFVRVYGWASGHRLARESAESLLQLVVAFKVTFLSKFGSNFWRAWLSNSMQAPPWMAITTTHLCE